MNAAGIFAKSGQALIVASSLIAATSVAGFAQDVTVGLGTLANDPMTNAYLNPPTGKVLLGGHTFDLTSGNMIPLAGGQSASLSGSYPNATAAYLLINSYNTFLNYAGATIGQVVLKFSDGTTQTTNLVVGTNLREWRPAGTNTVNTATDPAWSNVWTGQAQPAAGGGTAVIDMLTIKVAGTGKTLTGISIANQDLSGIGLIVPAVTIDDAPAAPKPTCIRPGESCETPAAQKSHAKKWQPTETAPTASSSDADKHDKADRQAGNHDRHGDD